MHSYDKVTWQSTNKENDGEGFRILFRKNCSDWMQSLMDEGEPMSLVLGYQSLRTLLRGGSDGPDMSARTGSVAGTLPVLLVIEFARSCSNSAISW